MLLLLFPSAHRSLQASEPAVGDHPLRNERITECSFQKVGRPLRARQRACWVLLREAKKKTDSFLRCFASIAALSAHHDRRHRISQAGETALLALSPTSRKTINLSNVTSGCSVGERAEWGRLAGWHVIEKKIVDVLDPLTLLPVSLFFLSFSLFLFFSPSTGHCPVFSPVSFSVRRIFLFFFLHAHAINFQKRGKKGKRGNHFSFSFLLALSLALFFLVLLPSPLLPPRTTLSLS